MVKLDHSGRETLRNRKYLKIWKTPTMAPQDRSHSTLQRPIPSPRENLATTQTSDGDTPSCEWPPDEDETPTHGTAETEASSNQDTQSNRPQRLRRSPERLQYKTLGNPS